MHTTSSSLVYFVSELRGFRLTCKGAPLHVIFEIRSLQLQLHRHEISSTLHRRCPAFPYYYTFTAIMVKATKQTKKFVSSGKLKQTIEKRRKYQQVQKKVAGREIRKAAKEKNGKGKHADETSDEEDEDIIVESDEDAGSKKNKGKG